MKTLLGILLLVLISCAPKAIVTEPIAPAVAKLSEAVAATAAAAKRSTVAVASIKQQSTDMRLEMVTAMLAADRIRKAGLATQEDLDANAEAWKAVHVRNLFLEAAAKTAVIDASELEAAARRSSEDAVVLEEVAAVHDKAVVELKTAIVKQADNAALGKAVKSVVWILSIISIIAVIAFAASRARLLG